MFKLYCCGSRGSRPVEGRRFNEFGGFTSCYILKTEDYALIIDCGTGFYEANHIVCDCSKVDIVLTHVHYDHILGMLDWTAIPKTSIVNFYANFDDWFGQDTMIEFFRKPFWPVQPDFKIHQCPPDGSPLELRPDLSVEFYSAPHPNGAKLLLVRHKEIEYRNGKPILTNLANVEENRLAVMFDCESSDGFDYDLIRNCDLLLYDGMYTDEEYPSKVGYGHSTWEEGCRLANKINCGKLIITHHSPDRNDDDLRSYETQARLLYPNTDFARAGQIWDLTPEVAKKKRLNEKIADFLDNNMDEDVTSSMPSKTRRKLKKASRALGIILTDEEKMRRFMAQATYVVLCIVSLFMTLVNVFSPFTELMYSTIAFSVACFINAMLGIFWKKGGTFISILFQIEFIALFTFFLWSCTPQGFSITWILLLPTMGMLVFGRKMASVSSVVMFLIIIFFFWTPVGHELIKTNPIDFIKSNADCIHGQVMTKYYSEQTMIRFPFAYIAFYMVGFILETIRHYGYTRLNKLRAELKDRVADQTSELREQNFELTRVNSQLGLRNRLLNNTFGRFMPEHVVDELLENPNVSQLEGTRLKITTLQCDVRGFTQISKTMNPLDAIGMLNHYFAEMTDIVQRHNGTILDFVGDAIFVAFGAPLQSVCQADDAIDTAIEMQKAMNRINEWNEANFYPEMKIGIGIHSGSALLGTVGSARHIKYDALGGDVNICSRIEGIARDGEILVTDATLAICQEKYEEKGVREEKIKGVEQPMKLHSIKY